MPIIKKFNDIKFKFEDDGIKSVAYGNIIAVLIEAIKELKLKLDNK